MATAAVTLPKLRRRPVNPLVAGRASFPEVYFTKHVDNSRLVREVGLEKWREYFDLLVLGILVFLFGLLFSWQHLQCVQNGYEIEGLKAQRVKMLEWNHQLRLSQAGLADPQRIDTLARKNLGMVSPSPQQVIQWRGVDEPSWQEPERAQVARNSPTVGNDSPGKP
ncbi:MAG TPA: cell division protein FtsL [Terriglobia bacterium]|nr:cell division protein FtsL [Terriglobia bacterium]